MDAARAGAYGAPGRVFQRLGEPRPPVSGKSELYSL